MPSLIINIQTKKEKELVHKSKTIIIKYRILTFNKKEWKMIRLDFKKFKICLKIRKINKCQYR